MRKNKKGVDLSINIIIIGALALIVLVIMILIFTGRMNIFGKGLTEETKKLPCPDTHEAMLAAECASEDSLVGNYDVKAGSVCCRKP